MSEFKPKDIFGNDVTEGDTVAFVMKGEDTLRRGVVKLIDHAHKSLLVVDLYLSVSYYVHPKDVVVDTETKYREAALTELVRIAQENGEYGEPTKSDT